MAEKKKKETSTEQKPKKKRGGGGLGLLIVLMVTAIVFLPTTMLLATGMLPTIVAGLTDRSVRKSKALTVGAMNLAGCSLFLFQLWSNGHTYQKSLEMIMDPMTIVVMYVAASAGYILDWGLCGVVASFLHQKGLIQQKIIREKQKELAQRWGKEVTGNFVLDDAGFIKNQDSKR